MRTTSDLQPFLSQKPIVLVVEDRVTKVYLAEAWGADEQFFNILTVGGSKTVEGVVEDLRKHRHNNVFGFVDRDFGDTNYDRWSLNGEHEVLRASFHEIENVLLDWPALAGCEINQSRRRAKSLAYIEETAMIEARRQPWWLACRRCLASWQRNLCQGFPTAPKLADVTDLGAAFRHLAGSNWLGSLRERTQETLDREALQAELREAHAAYERDLASDNWKASFSGKEVFHVLVSRIHDVPRSVSREADVDLAKSVGRWQYENSAVPAEIEQLKAALMGRVGLTLR
jgi:hypothetical protein